MQISGLSGQAPAHGACACPVTAEHAEWGAARQFACPAAIRVERRLPPVVLSRSGGWRVLSPRRFQGCGGVTLHECIVS